MTEREAFEQKTRFPEQTDYKLLLYRYTRYWYLFVLGVVLALILAFLYLSLATPKYRISTSIKVLGVNRDPDYQAGSPGFRRLDVFDEGTNLEDEIEALRSLSLLERVLLELGLAVGYTADDGLEERELYGQELPIRVIPHELQQTAYKKEITLRIRDNSSFTLEDEADGAAVYQFGQQIRAPYGSFTVEALPQLTAWNKDTGITVSFHNPRELVTHYNERISVVQVGEESSVLNISMLHPLPQMGKDILDKLVELYNQGTREDRNRLAHNTIQFIDARLQDVTADLASVEQSVEQFRRENRVTNPTADASAYLEESRVYDRQLSDLNIRINVLEALDKYLREQKEQYELVPSNLTIDDPTLLNLINRFNELQLERKRKLRNVEPSNILLQNLNQQLENLRRDILENLKVIRQGLTVQRANTAQKAANFRSRIEQVPGIERELAEINRRLQVQQDLHNFLLQKREEAALSLAATTPNTRLIDPAIASREPVEPNVPVVLLMAFALGLALPFGALFVKDFLDNTVKLRKEVEQLSTAPILGEVPHVAQKTKWATLHEYSTPLAEQMGLLISNLQLKTPDTAHKVLLITSGKNGEGKTFFSKNLALRLSLSGKRVLLLELDLRNPSLLQDFGLPNDVGITDYVGSDSVPIDDIIKPLAVAPNLYIIGTGPASANPAEVFAGPWLGDLIINLRERFDYILIDTAPAGKVADAFSLAPFADLCLYIVRYNYTLKTEITAVESPNLRKKLKKPVIVLNDARKMNSHHVS